MFSPEPKSKEDLVRKHSLCIYFEQVFPTELLRESCARKRLLLMQARKDMHGNVGCYSMLNNLIQFNDIHSKF